MPQRHHLVLLDVDVDVGSVLVNAGRGIILIRKRQEPALMRVVVTLL